MKPIRSIILVAVVIFAMLGAADYFMDFLGDQLNSNTTESVEDMEFEPIPYLGP